MSISETLEPAQPLGHIAPPAMDDPNQPESLFPLGDPSPSGTDATPDLLGATSDQDDDLVRPILPVSPIKTEEGAVSTDASDGPPPSLNPNPDLLPRSSSPSLPKLPGAPPAQTAPAFSGVKPIPPSMVAPGGVQAPLPGPAINGAALAPRPSAIRRVSIGIAPPENERFVYRAPFVVDLDMVKRTMHGVNQILGVDLSEVEVTESALLDDPSKDQAASSEANAADPANEPKDSVIVAKGEYSHMRLICEACGHIVAAVGRAVLEAAKESFDENVKQGMIGARPKPPLRKKRGGILGFKELAARANLSPWHFHRVFRVTTGVTPKTYGEALWEYLMLESGFNLENEELTIDRTLRPKASAVGAAAAGVSPPSSSSSPQSPAVPGSYSPSSTSRSPPTANNSGTLSQGSATALAAVAVPAQAQAAPPNAAGPGNGRIRKARSRSRPSRSRSRTRSQSQGQILSSLSALGDSSAVVDPAVPRGRSFHRGVQPSVPGVVPHGMQSASGIPGGIPIAQPQQHPSTHIGADPAGLSFEPEWLTPTDDLLSGMGGQLPSSRDVNMASLGMQSVDIPDVGGLSLQQLGLDHSSVPVDAHQPHQGGSADVQRWHMMNQMGSAPPSATPSVPDMMALNSTYMNMDRFKSPETIAKGDGSQQFEGAFSIGGSYGNPQNGYDDSGLSTGGYADTLSMNSFNNNGDFMNSGSLAMPNGGVIGHDVLDMSNIGINSAGMNGISDDVSAPVHGNLNHHIRGRGRLSSTRIDETPLDSLQNTFPESYQETLPENLHENLHQDIYQQPPVDTMGSVADLPAAYYMDQKGAGKYDSGQRSSAYEDDFVSALIGDSPSVLAPWNEANESPANEFDF